MLPTVGWAEAEHRVRLREAGVAQQAGQTVQAIERLEMAAAIRPDYPRVQWLLARLYALQERPADAWAALTRLADFGLFFPMETDRVFAAWRADPRWIALSARFQRNLSPVGNVRMEAESRRPLVDGIIEAVAVEPGSSRIFLSDVRHRTIWTYSGVSSEPLLERFSVPEDGLLGVFALKVDPAATTLWVTSSAVPELQSAEKPGAAASRLLAYDLATRRLRRVWTVPEDGRAHVLGDFALAADGTVYVSDSASPILWRLRPGSDELERWVESPDFVSLQGLAVSADERSLHVADYGSGLWRIERESGAMVALSPPAGATLFGIDGLYAVPGGMLAVQNGVNPQRIIRLALNAGGEVAEVAVLASGHAAMTELGLGQVVEGSFLFIGDSGWSRFERGTTQSASRSLTLLRFDR